ncbi:tetratricopeptide repeat protein [Virgisporangium aurantiacum]|nr:hypothetical protein [Virgisporangium aurantiacum]
MARSTVNDICTGVKVPTREQMEAFLRMCRREGDAATPYLDAWERVNDSGSGRPRHTRRVREWDPLLLGVHRSIRLPDSEGELPIYVRRDVDDEIRRSLRRGKAGGECFMLLVGDSSVGKTRTAFETLLAEVPNWWLTNPRSHADLEAVAADPGRHTVVWLDEITRVLRNGLTAGIVRALLFADDPVLIVGTMWPGPYRLFRTRPSEDWARDPYENHREVLQLATVVRVDKMPSSDESDRAAVAATTDRRLAKAATSRYGIFRALAAVPALIDHWQNAPDALSQTLVTVAADAARLGAQTPLSLDLLRDAVTGYLTVEERPRATAQAWAVALAYGVTELDGAATMLEPIGSELGVTDSYRVADALVEHIGAARAAAVPPASAWEAYCTHISTDADLFELGVAAEKRMLLQYAERLYRSSDTAESLLALGYLLLRQDRQDEAVASWRGALERELGYLHHLVEDLDAMGWPEIVDELLRFAGVRGEPYVLGQLVDRLDERLQSEQADRLLREAADAGLPGAHVAHVLRHHGPLSVEAEQVLRQAIADGDPSARYLLSRVLTDRGRLDSVEQLWREGIAEGDPEARSRLADLLMRQDREEEIERLWRAGITAREPRAWEQFVDFLREFDRPVEAEQAWRDAADAGFPVSRSVLVQLLVDQRRLSEAEALLRELVNAGEMQAAELAEFLYERDRVDDVEALWRRRLADGHRDAISPLADLLQDQSRTEELERLWRQHIDRLGGVDSLTRLLAAQDRDAEIEPILRQRTTAGDGLARIQLIRRLEGEDRLDAAEQVHREAIAAGREKHMALAMFFKRNGRLEEAEQVFRLAVACGEDSAWWGLVTVVAQRGRIQEAQDLQRHGLNPDGSTALGSTPETETDERNPPHPR